ncbi:hypothetical protein LZ31DRAFT_546610 [Colletotrichum somersetense]|nr:hypothetical protein LZ31DRAFT_546610 [Colletotrichum somersetense]
MATPESHESPHQKLNHRMPTLAKDRVGSREAPSWRRPVASSHNIKQSQGERHLHREGTGVLPTNETYRGVAEETKQEWRVPKYGAQPGPDYMVDNTNNYYGVATQERPRVAESGSFEGFMADSLVAAPDIPVAVVNHTFIDVEGNATVVELESELLRLADNSWWLPELSGLGKQPIVGGDYKFFRNVKTYGATGGGEEDDAEAINAAIEDGNRCGRECGNTFAQGAIIYFPPGVYKICTPIIQLYFTQFFGNPHVSQACSLQNLIFEMPEATDDEEPTHVGIFLENGSGYFVSDPVFKGGNIGWRAAALEALTVKALVQCPSLTRPFETSKPQSLHTPAPNLATS